MKFTKNQKLFIIPFLFLGLVTICYSLTINSLPDLPTIFVPVLFLNWIQTIILLYFFIDKIKREN